MIVPPASSSQVVEARPAKLNLEKLIPDRPRPDYQRDVLDPLRQAQKAAQKAAEEREAEHQRELEQEEARQAEESRRESVQAAQALGDCYEAMRATWPSELWAGAAIVMQKESSATSNKIGPTLPDGTIGHNADGSQDFGCFQINNFAHPEFFAPGSTAWANPYQNAAKGYEIYLGRHNFSAWYAVKGILW